MIEYYCTAYSKTSQCNWARRNKKACSNCSYKVKVKVSASDKIEALKDIIDACKSIEISGGTFEDLIDIELYKRIQAFTTCNLSSRDRKDEYQVKAIYLDALNALNEFLDSNSKRPGRMFKDIYRDLYLEFAELLKEIS